MRTCTHDAADPEMCIMCLRAERDALKAKLDATSKQFGTCSVCGYVAWKDRDARTQDCQYCALKAKLDASERAAAEMRALLPLVPCCCDTANFGSYTCPRCRALCSDAGRDYVPLQFRIDEINGFERELAYIAEKLMRPGDHSLLEAVDRVAEYVPRSDLPKAAE